MKLAIVTAGAVGAYFGSRFIKQGAAVHFVARGAHLTALREMGIKVKTRQGDTLVPHNSFKATENAALAVKDADLVLFAVKSFDTERLAKAMLPGLGANTVVLTLQNGVDNEDTIASVIGAERTAGGITYVFAHLDGAGTVNCPTNTGQIVMANTSLNGNNVPAFSQFRALCEAAGVGCETTDELPNIKWTKLVFNSALNGWTTLRRSSLDKIMKDPEIKPRFIATMAETIAVAQASGVKLADNVLEKTVTTAEAMGSVGSSMLGDYERGRRLEVDAINGVIMRKGKQFGIPTPENEYLYNELSAISV